MAALRIQESLKQIRLCLGTIAKVADDAGETELSEWGSIADAASKGDDVATLRALADLLEKLHGQGKEDACETVWRAVIESSTWDPMDI